MQPKVMLKPQLLVKMTTILSVFYAPYDYVLILVGIEG